MRRIDFFPGALELLAAHQAELPQKDDMCGAFWGTLALRQLTTHGVEQDDVADAAGTRISTTSPDAYNKRLRGRTDYLRPPKLARDEASSGTAVTSLAEGIATLGDRTVQAHPIAGPFSEHSVQQLCETLCDVPEKLTVVANVATRFLCASRVAPDEITNYLAGRGELNPEPDWDVGHFLGLVGIMRGSERDLIVCADTYPELGWRGIHVQPASAIAAGLNRDGLPSKGGLLIIDGQDSANEVPKIVANCGLSTGFWDNGSQENA